MLPIPGSVQAHLSRKPALDTRYILLGIAATTRLAVKAEEGKMPSRRPGFGARFARLCHGEMALDFRSRSSLVFEPLRWVDRLVIGTAVFVLPVMAGGSNAPSVFKRPFCFIHETMSDIRSGGCTRFDQDVVPEIALVLGHGSRRYQ
jgi:hypothetical protein